MSSGKPVSRKENALLPSVNDLAKMPPRTAESVLRYADSVHQRDHNLAKLGMLCGTITFVAVILAFVVLVVHGYEKAAAGLLGGTVLAVIGRMLNPGGPLKKA